MTGRRSSAWGDGSTCRLLDLVEQASVGGGSSLAGAWSEPDLFPMTVTPAVLVFQVSAEDLGDLLERAGFASEVQIRPALAPFDREHAARNSGRLQVVLA